MSDCSMHLRHASLADLDELERIESICFPPSEAANRQRLQERLDAFPKHFWVLVDAEGIAGFINGMVCESGYITDDMYADAAVHDDAGAWQTVFGLSVLPRCRRRGYAAALMLALIEQARSEGRKGCFLTCKEPLIHYYEKFGYRNEGLSGSEHGGSVWYDMRLTF